MTRLQAAGDVRAHNHLSSSHKPANNQEVIFYSQLSVSASRGVPASHCETLLSLFWAELRGPSGLTAVDPDHLSAAEDTES